MKTILRSIAASILASLARGVLHRYKPQIVMVTGSVGKTSTKDALAACLSTHYFLRASDKSYNSEFGVPLTIIGVKTPWNNPIEWIKVFWEGFVLQILPSHYPNLLVLEVGADRPGDLAKILKIATPDLVVVTRLPEVPVHVEAYAGPQAVREEEFLPALALPAGAPLILSADDIYARQMAARLQAKVITYGYAEDADVRLLDSSFTDTGLPGMCADIDTGEGKCRLEARGVLGRQQLFAPAAAFAAARELGLTAKEALKGLSRYSPPPGRARILPGKHHSLIIDDTYNASPAAVEEALAALMLIGNAKRRIAVLGDMLELGRYSVEEHARIGKLAAKEVDMLITVGSRARSMRTAAIEAGMAEGLALSYDTPKEAADFILETLKEGDVVLLKGSQSVRMERAVEMLLLDSADVKQLVRQEKEWLGR
ncbi:MAG: UDP-N-acetylmuramoyl-tripeptide--D-alanyl-D-alanine ligase [Parcubacteria group bacterium]|nr:UDP-N-acetylmuramoyl-tripeptide--D-alanyl-D-alanine ligase [Parcubacteria group bacterium]